LPYFYLKSNVLKQEETKINCSCPSFNGFTHEHFSSQNSSDIQALLHMKWQLLQIFFFINLLAKWENSCISRTQRSTAVFQLTDLLLDDPQRSLPTPTILCTSKPWNHHLSKGALAWPLPSQTWFHPRVYKDNVSSPWGQPTSQQVAQSASWEVSKTRLEAALSKLVWHQSRPCCGQKVGPETSRGPFHPKSPHNPEFWDLAASPEKLLICSLPSPSLLLLRKLLSKVWFYLLLCNKKKTELKKFSLSFFLRNCLMGFGVLNWQELQVGC